MRRLSHGALLGFLTVSAIWLIWSLTGPVPLSVFIALFAGGDVPVRLDRLELQRHLDGAAGPHRRHGGVRSGFHADAGRRLDRGDHRPAFDGTVTPLAAGFCGVAFVGLVMVLIAEREDCSRPQPAEACAVNP